MHSKKEVSCKWEQLPPPAPVLHLNQKIYQITPRTTFIINDENSGWFEIICDLLTGQPLGSDFEPDTSEDIVIGQGKNRQKKQLFQEDIKAVNGNYWIRLGDCPEERISWLGYFLEVRKVSTSLKEIRIVRQNENIFPCHKGKNGSYSCDMELTTDCLFDTETGTEIDFEITKRIPIPHNAQKLSGKHILIAANKIRYEGAIVNVTDKWLSELSESTLALANGKKLPSAWSISASRGEVTLDTKGDTPPEHLIVPTLPGLTFSCIVDTEEQNWIQLIGLDYGQDDASQDPLEFFFDSDVEIQDGNGRNSKPQYRPLRSRPDERQILLTRIGDKKRQPILPNSEQIKVRVNTLSLHRQLETITHLKSTPYKEHEALLALLKPREEHYWQPFSVTNNDDITWAVLTDLSFDGCDKQREFVSKAMATPDFAILDGPPGTGKTTTIIELIVQLVRQKKRILLTASTHAAINNVLERIDEQKLGNEI